MKISDKTGMMVVIREVVDTDDVVVVTTGGMVIRQHAKSIRVAGRNTQGVRLIRLGESDAIADVVAVVNEDEQESHIQKASQESSRSDLADSKASDGKEKTNGEKGTDARQQTIVVKKRPVLKAKASSKRSGKRAKKKKR